MQSTTAAIQEILSPATLAKNAKLAKEVQGHLVRLGLLDPPIDGRFGPYSAQALSDLSSRLELA